MDRNVSKKQINTHAHARTQTHTHTHTHTKPVQNASIDEKAGRSVNYVTI